MHEFYVESQLKLRHLRQSAVGAHLDGFADRLRLSGYQQRPAQMTYGAQHISVIGHQHTAFSSNIDDSLSERAGRARRGRHATYPHDAGVRLFPYSHCV